MFLKFQRPQAIIIPKMGSPVKSITSSAGSKISSNVDLKHSPIVDSSEKCDPWSVEGLSPAVSKKIHLVNDVCLQERAIIQKAYKNRQLTRLVILSTI